MKFYANEWGADVAPREYKADPIRAYKFMDLRHPVVPEFGGHFSLEGSYGNHSYGSDQVAACPNLHQWDQEPDLYRKHIEDHEDSPFKDTRGIPGPPFSSGCRCGIYSQHLSHIRDYNEYGGTNSFCQLDLSGNNRYSEAGWRSSHVRVMKLWTTLDLDNDHLAKAQNDLGIVINRVPMEYRTNGGGAHWAQVIDNTPEIQNDLIKERATIKELDRQTAAKSTPNGVCENCGSPDIGLVHRSGTQGQRGGNRDAICNSCNNRWSR